MRNCPTCESSLRVEVWTMSYKVPDNWPLPHAITWFQCINCRMLYGDGDFNQELLNAYYRNYYGYGVNSADVNNRLTGIADYVAEKYPGKRFVDFGGSGDDGKSIAVEHLKDMGYLQAWNVNAGDPVPFCDVLLASHVIEHVYDMEDVMDKISGALSPDGLLIVDGPDATGLLELWGMPMLDFHTKHINHFRLIDYLRLMERYGFELMDNLRYFDIRSSQTAPCYRMYFKRYSMAAASRDRVQGNIGERLAKLRQIDYPVNVWGLGDITWHLLAQAALCVVQYIDNDPAYRGQSYDGKPVVERPTNDEPIVILAQGQREKLIKNIRAMGVDNATIEI